MLIYMTEPTWFRPPTTRRLAGTEPIVGTDRTVADFWSWSASDFRSNTLRALLAEFLVATAVGAHAGTRVEWDSYDVLAPGGHRIEVKASAYLQAWPQRKPSTIKFGGLRSRTIRTENLYNEEKSYNAIVYVFALLNATEHAVYDALDTDQWTFWVVPGAKIRDHGSSSVSLATVERLSDHRSVRYAALAQAIAAAVAGPDEAT